MKSFRLLGWRSNTYESYFLFIQLLWILFNEKASDLMFNLLKRKMAARHVLFGILYFLAHSEFLKKWNEKEFSKVTSLNKRIKVKHVKSFPWLKRTSQYHNISNFIVFYFKENMVNGEDKKDVAKCIKFLQHPRNTV